MIRYGLPIAESELLCIGVQYRGYKEYVRFQVCRRVGTNEFFVLRRKQSDSGAVYRDRRGKGKRFWSAEKAKEYAKVLFKKAEAQRTKCKQVTYQTKHRTPKKKGVS